MNSFLCLYFYFHKSAEEDSGNLEETVGASGDEDPAKAVNNVRISCNILNIFCNIYE